MQRLNNEQYSSLRHNAVVIEADHYGEKVLKLHDGSFLKLFRRKRMISSATLISHASRFAANVRKLKQRGIVCPKIIAIYRISGIERTAVHYWPLPGDTLRQLFEQSSDSHASRANSLGALIAELHNKGVYFRSLHLGNVIQGEQGELGLIDVSDMTCNDAALGRIKRSRNFKHLFRYKRDVSRLNAYRACFIDGYVRHLPERHATYFRKKLGMLFDEHTQEPS